MAITTSQTEINAIDALYPVAGQDNDSQGFRDNFSNIKNSLTKAKTDLDTLDTNTAKLNSANDFNGNEISEANMKANTEVVYDIGPVSASQNVNWDNGHYQKAEIGGNLTFTLTSWPSGSNKLARLTLMLKSDGSPRTVTLAAGGGGDIKYNGMTDSVALDADANKHKLIDFWTDDEGDTIYAKYLGEFE